MIQIVFIGNDKKCLSIIKMSVPNINISLTPFSAESIIFIRKDNPDIVLLDLDQQNEEWVQLFKQIKNINKPPSILVTGEYSSSERVIKAIKMGALDYIPKPFNQNNLHLLEQGIKKSIIITLENTNRSSKGKNSHLLDSVIGYSKQIQTVKDLMLSYAASGAAVLLLGESGVGKNLIAQTIHKISKRGKSTYKTIHTAGIPATLIESELYGTNEGAFTGATSRPGCFESASNGTLFLDEIGELPLSSQVKLLRILEEKTITRLGGTRQIPIDVRIISATNINLSRAVRNRLFRQDLYYRINTLTINIPPLRERKEDIPLLVDRFLKEQDCNYRINSFCMEKLTDHSWPGNIRELKSTIERSKALAGDLFEIDEKYIKFYD